MRVNNKALVFYFNEALMPERTLLINSFIELNYFPVSFHYKKQGENFGYKSVINESNIIVFLYDYISTNVKLNDFLANDALEYAIRSMRQVYILVRSNNPKDNFEKYKRATIVYWNDEVSLRLCLGNIVKKQKEDYKDIFEKQRHSITLIKVYSFSSVVLSLLLSFFIIMRKDLELPFNDYFLIILGVMIIMLGFVIYFYTTRLNIVEPSSRYEEFLENKLSNKPISFFQRILSTSKTNCDIDVEDEHIANIKDDENIIYLMLKNSIETTEYFSISKQQAKSSYKFSIVACSIGIIILVFSVILAFALNRIEPAIIAAVSGAITELIAGTVLWVHNKSALQLNHYYNALHENEKFLSAINIADSISDEKRDDVYFEIIKKQLEAASFETTYHKSK